MSGSKFFTVRKSHLAAIAVAAAMLGGLEPGSRFLPALPSACADVTNPSCWKVDVVPDDQARQADRDQFTDFLTFDSLGFTAEALAKLGFPSTDVTINPDGTFSVSVQSDAHGTVVWAGTLNSNRINGTMTWSRDGNVYRYNFSGVPFNP